MLDVFGKFVLAAFGLCLLSGCASSVTPMSIRMDAVSPTPIAISTRPADGAVMVYVPGGAFVMGSSDAEIREALADCRNCPDDWFDAERPTQSQPAGVLDRQIRGRRIGSSPGLSRLGPPSAGVLDRSGVGVEDARDSPAPVVSGRAFLESARSPGGRRGGSRR